MDDVKFKKLEEKFDKLDEKLDSIDKTLVKQHEQLAHHIYRTDQNEHMIKTLNTSLKPVQSHVSLMNNIAKIVIFLGILAAIYKNLK